MCKTCGSKLCLCDTLKLVAIALGTETHNHPSMSTHHDLLDLRHSIHRLGGSLFDDHIFPFHFIPGVNAGHTVFDEVGFHSGAAFRSLGKIMHMRELRENVCLSMFHRNPFDPIMSGIDHEIEKDGDRIQIRATGRRVLPLALADIGHEQTREAFRRLLDTKAKMASNLETAESLQKTIAEMANMLHHERIALRADMEETFLLDLHGADMRIVLQPPKFTLVVNGETKPDITVDADFGAKVSEAKSEVAIAMLKTKFPDFSEASSISLHKESGAIDLVVDGRIVKNDKLGPIQFTVLRQLLERFESQKELKKSIRNHRDTLLDIQRWVNEKNKLLPKLAESAQSLLKQHLPDIYEKYQGVGQHPTLGFSIALAEKVDEIVTDVPASAKREFLRDHLLNPLTEAELAAIGIQDLVAAIDQALPS